jgi:radical SAM superfamily enzyme YgiQ (UPF0313 family)
MALFFQMAQSPLVLLLQLPIPPPGPGLVEGNVPLAAGYLKLHAFRQGCNAAYDIDILPPESVNVLSDQGLIEEILGRNPWMVGFSCYLWNIDRTLWIASQLKQQRPDLKIVLGGPEITADNAWVLKQPSVDFAVLGEGEQTFVDLLTALKPHRHDRPKDSNSGPALDSKPLGAIPGFWQSSVGVLPPARMPLAELDSVSSPYLEGFVEVGGDRRMLLETARGCRFRCKYCFYPKHYDSQRFLSFEQVLANLNHAVEHGATEVVLLDPTLNQRPDFLAFLKLLAQGNPKRQFTYSAELRAEGIDAVTAKLLHTAHFDEVEIGLQSIEPRAWQLMRRPTNLPAFERGVQAMIGEGIRVCVDLILGLPGDTVDSVRRAIDYLHDHPAFSEAEGFHVQAFNLSVLPGTAFREEAASLGLKFQPRPPYYVLNTPSLNIEQMLMLMEEVQEAFGVEFDALPIPQTAPQCEKYVDVPSAASDVRHDCRIDLDRPLDAENSLPLASKRAQAFTLSLHAADFHSCRREAEHLIRQVLTENPHTTLQVVLHPKNPSRLTEDTLQQLLAVCYEQTTYLDRYYSLHPGRLLGAKQIAVLLPLEQRAILGLSWRETMSQWATLLWQGISPSPDAFDEFEYLV